MHNAFVITAPQLIAMYNFKPLFYDIIIVKGLQLSDGFSMKCIGYNTNCIDAATVKYNGHRYTSYCNQYTL